MLRVNHYFLTNVYVLSNSEYGGVSSDTRSLCDDKLITVDSEYSSESLEMLLIHFFSNMRKKDIV